MTKTRPRKKAQDTPDKYLRSTVTLMDGMGEKGAKPRPFRQDLAVKQFYSWVYRAAMLNAHAFSSVPLRLYVRNRKGATTKYYATKAVNKRRVRYLCGDAEQRPSKSVLHKVAEIGADFVEVTEPHPALKVLAQVNPWQNGFDLSTLRLLYLQVTGNSYLHPVMDGLLGVPRELWLMPSQWVQIIPSTTGFIAGYVYGRRPDEQQFASDEVIQFKLPNLADVHYGMGWVEALWSAIGLHNAKRTMDTAKFDNFARPDWLLVVKSGAGEGALDRLEASIESKLKGARNSGRFLSVTGDVQAIPLNFEVSEIGDPEKVIQEIAAVSAVPLYKLQGNDPIKANSDIQDYGWMRDTILPYCRLDEEQLNARYLPLFGIGDDAVLAYDNPVPDDEAKSTDIAIKRAGGPISTVNEVRQNLGDEPIPGGDELRSPPIDASAALVTMMGQGRGNGEPATGSGPASVGAAGDIQATVLNGAQMTAMQTIVAAVAAGEIPRDSGVQMLAVGLQISSEQADKIMGTAGTSKPTTPNPNPQREAELQAQADAAQNRPQAAPPPPAKAFKRRVNATSNGIARELPQGSKLIPILQATFEAQEKGVLLHIGKAYLPPTFIKHENEVPPVVVDLRSLAPRLAKEAEPILAAIMEEEGKRLIVELGGGFDVFERNVPKAAQQMSIKLAESINETTQKNLADAVQQLRDEISEGLVEGDARPELIKRVQAVFENASKNRAAMIARTEASRAAHTGELMGAKDSGVVSRKFWLASADACEEICQPIVEANPDGVPLDDDFEDSDVPCPPAHPNCQCSLTYSVEDQEL